MSTVESTSSLGFDQKYGLKINVPVYRNLNYDELREHELRNGEGSIASNGAFCTDTGIFTGRSPNDKYTVKQAPSESNMWWGKVNVPITPAVWADLKANTLSYMNTKPKQLYVFDGYCGANPKSSRKVRFITEFAWHSHFVRNMFIRPETDDEIKDFTPDFTIINSCMTTFSGYKEAGMYSENYVAFNNEEKLAIVGGPQYGVR